MLEEWQEGRLPQRTHGIANSLLSVLSRMPPLFPADGSWEAWAHVAGRKTLHAAEMLPASSDHPAKEGTPVPGRDTAAGPSPEG